jgi:O-acetyl-ADP-ribose deacetylase (regulator of RNase III)
MQRCLNLAEKKQLKYIAFPAVGAGNLKYPLDIVADEMFRTVDDWQGTYVKEVKFVIYPNDTSVLQVSIRVYNYIFKK